MRARPEEGATWAGGEEEEREEEEEEALSVVTLAGAKAVLRLTDLDSFVAVEGLPLGGMEE